MFLLHFNQKHPLVATSTSWDEIMSRAATEILGLSITAYVLERFGLSEEALAAMGERPSTWVHLAVLEVVGEEDLVAERLPDAWISTGLYQTKLLHT